MRSLLYSSFIMMSHCQEFHDANALTVAYKTVSVDMGATRSLALQSLKPPIPVLSYGKTANVRRRFHPHVRRLPKRTRHRILQAPRRHENGIEGGDRLRDSIERTPQKTGGNRAAAVCLLDLNPKYFSELCKELNVKPE